MSSDEDDLFETLMRLQGSRIDEQRCPLPPAGKANPPSPHRWQEEGEALSRDELFDLILYVLSIIVFSLLIHNIKKFQQLTQLDVHL